MSTERKDITVTALSPTDSKQDLFDATGVVITDSGALVITDSGALVVHDKRDGTMHAYAPGQWLQVSMELPEEGEE